MKKTIDMIFAFVVIDDGEGCEGIPAVAGPNGIAMPMVVSDSGIAEAMGALAGEISERRGKTIELRVFEGPYKVLQRWEKKDEK